MNISQSMLESAQAQADIAKLKQQNAELVAALENIEAKLNEKSLDGSKRRAAAEEIARAVLAKVR